AALTDQAGERFDIDQAQEGVGQCFDKQEFGRLFQSRADCGEIVGVHEGRLDAEPNQLLHEELRGPTVESVAGDDPLALLYQSEYGGGDGGHAGAANDGPGAAFQPGQFIGELPSVGVCVTRVDEPGRLAVGDPIESVQVG